MYCFREQETVLFSLRLHARLKHFLKRSKPAKKHEYHERSTTFSIKMPVLTRLRNTRSSVFNWKHYIEKTCNWCTHKSRTAWRRKPAKKLALHEQVVNKTWFRKWEQIKAIKSSLANHVCYSFSTELFWSILQAPFRSNTKVLQPCSVQPWRCEQANLRLIALFSCLPSQVQLYSLPFSWKSTAFELVNSATRTLHFTACTISSSSSLGCKFKSYNVLSLTPQAPKINNLEELLLCTLLFICVFGKKRSSFLAVPGSDGK